MLVWVMVEEEDLSSNLEGAVLDLQDFYHGTKIEDYSLETQICLGETILSGQLIENGSPSMPFNKQWKALIEKFDTYVRKIPGTSQISSSMIKDDSHLTAVYNLVNQKGSCF